MNFIQPFETAIRNGVTLVFKVSAAGEQIQLDILPSGKDSKAGIALPPKALLGTAQELDEHLEAFMAKYAVAISRISEVIARADGDLHQLETTATEQARLALEEKRSRTAGKSARTQSAAPHKADRTAGLLTSDEDPTDDGSELSRGAGQGGSEAELCEGMAAAGPDVPPDTLSASLF
jgi:PRTRC genetic system protein E